jgi:hypothetical protein
MIGIIIYFIGVAVQYVRVNTVHKEWKEERINFCKKTYDPLVSTYLAVWGSWLAFSIMNIKRFLDNKFINL